jgi:hypothetical protein
MRHGQQGIINDCDPKERKRIILTKDPYEERVFTFDNIYDPSASQEEVF